MVEAELDEAKVPSGHFVVKIQFLTVDPYMRGTMNPMAYGMANPIGTVMRGSGVGVVVHSKHPGYAVGDTVLGPFGWQEFAVTNGMMVEKISKEWQMSHALGALGMPGATAYYGLFDVLKPRAGETLFVSGAAGAVGSLVGQLGKLAGLTVIGSTSGEDKIKFAKSVGFDHVLSYKDKTAEELEAELKKVAPQGIDIYFDNTGGPMTYAVVNTLNQFGRISICGQIAYYNLANPNKVEAPPLFMKLLMKQATAQGFLVTQFKPWTHAHNRMFKWIQEGKLVVHEDVVDGFENMVKAFFGLFGGANTGKQLVRLTH